MTALAETQTTTGPLSPHDLLAQLAADDVAFELHTHEPVFTVAEGAEIERGIPGQHCRNLFLRDPKGRMALLSLANETKIDLRRVAPLLGFTRVSFGSPERLWDHLGVRPGSVCPFAILNDHAHDVALYLDAALFGANRVNFHPLVNTMTVGLAPEALARFLKRQGHPAVILDFTPAAPEPPL